MLQKDTHTIHHMPIHGRHTANGTKHGKIQSNQNSVVSNCYQSEEITKKVPTISREWERKREKCKNSLSWKLGHFESTVNEHTWKYNHTNKQTNTAHTHFLSIMFSLFYFPIFRRAHISWIFFLCLSCSFLFLSTILLFASFVLLHFSRCESDLSYHIISSNVVHQRWP